MKILHFITLVLPFCINNQINDNKDLISSGRVDSAQSTYNIIDCLPAGFVKDGTVDYTDYIQKAINTHADLVFPAFPILVDDKGLDIGSNKRIVFRNGSKLILKPSDKARYSILNLHNVNNVTLVNPVIVGDRNGHIGTEGQWGMGISILSAKDITLKNPNVTDCWGDGIYITRDIKLPNTSQNIQISGAYCKNNRRNGISVVSVSGLNISSSYLGFSNGHSPESGIDIEPNPSKSNSDMIDNVTIEDLVTESNKGDGVLMDFCNYYGPNKKPINVVVRNHRDNGSSNGSRVIAYKLNSSVEGSISGNISFINALWGNNSKRSIDVRHFMDPNVKLNLKGLKATAKGDSKQVNTVSKSLLGSPSGASNITITP